MRVFRVYHSAVVGAWRQRDRWLEANGVDLTLVAVRRWNEGGSVVEFDAAGDRFATSATTWGSKPNLFLYNPLTLWRLMGRGPFDLLDFHEEPCSLAMAELLAIRALRARRVPFVVYSAQNIRKRYPPPFRWIERWCLRQAAAAYPCNEAAGRILREKGLRSPAVTLPLGVDLDRFSPAERQAPADRTLRVGFVGRLSAHKGVDALIKAVAATPGLTATIAGDGPDAAGLQALSASLGAAGRIDFVGYLSQAALPEFYRSLDALVVPSIPLPGWDEQFGRVAVEAMASGVPVIASATGALPEVVSEAGILINPGDPGALGRAFEALFDQGRWEAYRAAALKSAPRFGWEAVAEGHLNLYRRALDPGLAPDADPAPDRTPRSLTVVVVAYGPADGLDATLDDLEGRFPTVVVDNSQSEATRQVCKRHSARCLDPGGNIGFGAAVNLALQEIDLEASDVLLLNPDARIAPSAVEQLHSALLDDPSVAAVAPALCKPGDGQPERVTWPFPGPAQAWAQILQLDRNRPGDQFLIGAVLLLRGRALVEVGGFDERYFLYAEEADWQLRARRSGWQVRYCPQISGVHEGAGTGGDSDWRETIFHSSVERFVRKWHGDRGWAWFRATVLARDAVLSAVSTGTRRRAARRRFRLYRLDPIKVAESWPTDPTPDR